MKDNKKTILQLTLAFLLLGIATPAGATITKTLGLGSRDKEVGQLQNRLAEQNLLSKDNVTGYFGRTTQTALKLFQSNNNIESTGATGPKTRQALNNAQPANKANTTRTMTKTRGDYIEIVSPKGFLNTNGQEIKIADYVGKKVILVNFLTYSCINCQRTVPYLNEWYKKYEDKGLVIIGIHAPEFAFEKNIKNVQKELLEKQGVKFPVVLDNDFKTWGAYKNQFWPHKYLIDLNGNIVYDHIGEGKYQDTEDKIKSLLGL